MRDHFTDSMASSRPFASTLGLAGDKLSELLVKIRKFCVIYTASHRDGATTTITTTNDTPLRRQRQWRRDDAAAARCSEYRAMQSHQSHARPSLLQRRSTTAGTGARVVRHVNFRAGLTSKLRWTATYLADVLRARAISKTTIRHLFARPKHDRAMAGAAPSSGVGIRQVYANVRRRL